jgi:hypothetical protein
MSDQHRQFHIRSALFAAFVAAAALAVAVLIWVMAEDGPETRDTAGNSPIAAAPLNVQTAPVETKQFHAATAAPARPVVTKSAAEPPATTRMEPPAALPDQPARHSAESEAQVRTVLALAERSPQQALRWALAQPRRHSEAAIITAAYEAAREHPANALGALAQLPSSAERNAAIAHAAGQWGARDGVAASAWAGQLAPGDLREHACSALAVAMAERDPRAAADFVATQISDGVLLKTAAVAVAQRWAQQQPAAAKAWAEQFAPGPIRDDALREIAAQSAVVGK